MPHAGSSTSHICISSPGCRSAISPLLRAACTQLPLVVYGHCSQIVFHALICHPHFLFSSLHCVQCPRLSVTGSRDGGVRKARETGRGGRICEQRLVSRGGGLWGEGEEMLQCLLLFRNQQMQYYSNLNRHCEVHVGDSTALVDSGTTANTEASTPFA